MDVNDLKIVVDKLEMYCRNENFKGYDPYDTLNSWIPFKKFGNLISVLAIQIQKRNPINIIRPLLGIKKEYNPKGLGLFLKAYSMLYQIDKKEEYLETCNFLFEKIIQLKSKGYSGACWGYNFDWASPGSYLPKFTPSIVVTAFVVDGLIEYYEVNPLPEIKKEIVSTGDYILKDLPKTETYNGFCFAYTDKSKDCCYNASMLGAETLAKIYSLNNDLSLISYAKRAVNFVLARQKADGSWNYSLDLKTGKERKQIDFHQGFILMSLQNYIKYSGDTNTIIIDSIKRGLVFYKHEQFKDDGVSLWRLPKEYPIEIHNQAQGILTFAELSEYQNDYLAFAETVANWTIQNMQDKEGCFYYRNYRYYKNKIPFMRWSQAWMLVALTALLKKKDTINEK